MTTLAIDSPMAMVDGQRNHVPIIANDIVFEGAMVGENGAGYGRPLVAGDKFLGHAVAKIDNTGGSAGDYNIELLGGRYRLKVSLAGYITDVGQPVYASDDSVLTFIGAGASAANSFVGVVTRYISATELEVEFRPNEVDEFGLNLNRILKTDDYTTLVTDTGKIIYLGTTTKTVTLIATVAGIEVTIVNCAADSAALIHVDPNAADRYLGGCGVAANADGHKMSNTALTAKRGDYLKLLADGTNGWNIVGKRGTWAEE